jgi:hypothetical protein
MGTLVEFETRDEKLKKDIETQIGTLAKVAPPALPPADAAITKLYIKKIEGDYDVSRAKQDTDNAIDLLYIAYNATPQTEDEVDIRKQIHGIMDSLVKAQQASERAMNNVHLAVGNVLREVDAYFPDWLNARRCKGPEDVAGIKTLKAFLADDLLELAKAIKKQALKVGAVLDDIATTYDAILKDTENVTKKSETGLAGRLKDATAVRKQIAAAQAKRDQLEKLVEDLKLEVEKYDRLAKEYESKAKTAEERAFVLSIIKFALSILAGGIPLIVKALTPSGTGGGSVASGTVSTESRAVGDKNATGGKDLNHADILAAKRQIAEKAVNATELEEEVKEAQHEVAAVEDALKKQQEAEGKPTGTTTFTEKVEDDDSETVKAIRVRIGEKKEALKKAEDNYNIIIGELSGLQASVVALEKGLSEESRKKGEDTAAGLRKKQMEMLNKVQIYERERRTQNEELIKIKALLAGNLSEQETIQLAVQSLNVSISALKRTQEIIHEMAHFFKSFAAFLDDVCQETENDIKLFDDAVGRETMRKFYLENLIAGGDKFFLRQTAEWNAIDQVSDKFKKSFAEGWSKLNLLNRKYIGGNDLRAYMKVASEQIDRIVAERKAAADQKVLDLESYRKQVTDNATKTA